MSDTKNYEELQAEYRKYNTYDLEKRNIELEKTNADLRDLLLEARERIESLEKVLYSDYVKYDIISRAISWWRGGM
jgi:hypothetical protein